jgi:anhydro-N-acetylmuramic acid kinase
VSDPNATFLGCISGTSVDGLDIAAIRVHGDTIDVLGGTTYALPEDLEHDLLNLHTPGSDGVDAVGAADLRLGQFIGDSINEFVAQAEIGKADIRAIGSHGQTIRHRPSVNQANAGFTVQIGDPNQITERTGIMTVADFRRRDMAANGQGAPLVPPFHQALFEHTGDAPVILNLGGIGNVSILEHGEQGLLGFDTGPGNALMDAWFQRHQGGRYDANGDWARSGTPNTSLLDELLDDAYFVLAPPKSTGREYFTLAWLEQFAVKAKLAPVDVQATLAELTAASVADALTRWAHGTSNVIVCGGGRRNGYLIERIADRADAPVSSSEDWGVDGDSIEAAAFAWLAHQTLNGLPGNAPGVTGADGPRILGAVYPA